MAIQNIGTILTNIKSVLDTANTTTASDYLSNGMSSKVAYVGKIAPEKIIMNQDQYPFVTSYIDNYEIESETTARNQATGIRMSTFDVMVVGGVWNPNFSSKFEDPSDLDIYLLMQNVEQVFRNNTDLLGAVDYQKPNSVKFKSFVDEENDNHVRFGTMTLSVRKRY